MQRVIEHPAGPRTAATLLVATLVVLALGLVAGLSLRTAAIACAVAGLVVAVAAILAWQAAQARAARAEAAEGTARAAQREDRVALERHVRRLEDKQRREAELLERLRQSWKAEREWSRELRGQIQRLQQSSRVSHEAGHDLHGLVLEAAITLLDAEKGLLISREDEDGDGELDVVLAHGFEHDPRRSAVAQRYARAVLARDEIVREDAPGDAADASAADAEIDSLVAIPLFLRDRFHGVIVCANRPGGFEDVGEETLLALGDHAGAALHHGRLHHELLDAHRAGVRLLAQAVAAHDPVLHRETVQLAVHAGLLGEDLGLEVLERDVLICATLCRAVGYLALPDRPRHRAGPLTPDERALQELHPRLGFEILMQAPALREAATAILYHHECVDGTGYPAGLAGEEIPLAARVLAVLEAYGAMTNPRPYREAVSTEEACRALVEVAGTQLDAEITTRFVEQLRRRPAVASADVADAVLEALPLDPGATADGTLLTAWIDGPTLLGNRGRLDRDARAAARFGRPFGIVMLELVDLPRINADEGQEAGDRLILEAARGATRAAGRLGGSAYRVSGRRLGILLPGCDAAVLPGLVDEIRREFLAGAAIRIGAVASGPGERHDDVLTRARDALRGQPA